MELFSEQPLMRRGAPFFIKMNGWLLQVGGLKP